MPRLFVGTFLSNDGIDKLANLSGANEHLKEAWNAKIRWVDRTKLHITWVFLGDVESEVIPYMISELKLAVSSLSLREKLVVNYERFELWPNERKARLAVVVPKTIDPEVFTVDATIKKALKKFLPKDQLKHERKEFQPHITVLRFPHDHKASGTARIADLAVPEGIFPIEHIVDEIALIESDLGKDVKGYEKLAAFQL